MLLIKERRPPSNQKPGKLDVSRPTVSALSPMCISKCSVKQLLSPSLHNETFNTLTQSLFIKRPSSQWYGLKR